MTAPDPRAGRIAPGPWWGLLVLAALARLAFVTQVPDVVQFPDGREYIDVARSLLGGHGFGMQTLRPPGYPLFIAAVWAVTGPRLIALRVVEAMLGTVTVALVGRFGARGFGRTAGTVAMALAALHPVLAFLPSTQYSENLIVLVCVLAYGALFGALLDPRAGVGRWLAAGALFGGVALIRPNAVLLVPGLLLGAIVTLARARRRVVLPVAALLAAFALTLAPWIVRNHQVHGKWFFVATGGGRALWLGNNDVTSGRAGFVMRPDTTLAVTLYALPDDIARDAYLRELGMRWIAADPARAARMYLTHMGCLWALYPDTATRTRFMNPIARVAQGAMSVLLFAGALLALARRPWHPLYAPMVLAIVTFSLVNAVFFVVLRYRMPFEPLLIWMAAAGWTGLAAARGATGRV